MALELVENGNTGYVSRQKINQSISRVDNAVDRGGDIMEGALVAPYVRVMNIPIAPNDVITKKYFDEYNTLNGGSTTFSGPLPPETAFVNSSWYCTENGLTYIYLDDGTSIQWVEMNPNYPSAVGAGLAEVEYLPLTGGTLTGDLSVQSLGNRSVSLQTNVDYARVRFGHPSNNHGYGMVYTYSEAGGDYLSLQQYDVDGAYVNELWTYLPSTNMFEMQNPHSKSSQGTAGNSLTRRDWVEGAIAAGGGNFVKKIGDTMEGWLYAPKFLSTEPQSLQAGELAQAQWVDDGFMNAHPINTVVAQDFNTFTSNGMYNVQYGNNPAGAGATPNSPDVARCGSPYGVMLVMGDSTFRAQVYWPHHATGISNMCFRLCYGADAWAPWQYVLSPTTMVTREEYDALLARVEGLTSSEAKIDSLASDLRNRIAVLDAKISELEEKINGD